MHDKGAAVPVVESYIGPGGGNDERAAWSSAGCVGGGDHEGSSTDSDLQGGHAWTARRAASVLHRSRLRWRPHSRGGAIDGEND